MNYRALAAFGISITLISARVTAQSNDNQPSKPAKTSDKTSDKTSEVGTVGGTTASNASASKDVDASVTAKANVADAHDDATAKANAKANTNTNTNADVADAHEDANGNPKAADPHDDAAPATAPTEQAPPPGRAPVYGARGNWFIAPYGYARLDAIEDSTQSFEDGMQPNLIARVGTYAGDHRRTIFTAKDSRLGIFVGAPTVRGIRSSAQIEFDFYGLVPTDARRQDSVMFGPVRIRHAFLKVETKVVDVVAGQYYDLFGWGGYFYPGTVAYQGVPAGIYHRNPQLRIEKKVRLGQIELLAAVAAVRPGQRDSGIPDGQAGLKLAYTGWRGAATQGFGRPSLAPLSIGVSGVFRRFEVPAFRSDPGSEGVTTNGYGLAASALLPVIPIQTIDDQSNALTLTGEFSIGTGVADMYTGMDGGSRFPLLPNPSMAAPAVQYQANVDPGLVTFDRNFNLKTISWRAFVAGLQYHLPVDAGRVWLSGIYSRVWSDDIKQLTPFTSWGAIFTKMEYLDANIGFDITPAIALAVSFQTVKQTFGDVSAPTPVFGTIAGPTPGIATVQGTGGVAATARNNRGQISMALFF